MPVDEMLARIDSYQLAEYMAYYALENKPMSKKEQAQTTDDMKSVLMGLNPKRK